MLTTFRRATVIAVGIALVLELGGCGTTRSPEAFCKVYWDQKQTYLNKYDKSADQIKAAGQSDPLLGVFSGLATSLSAIGDVEIMFDKLDKVAPDDIESDIAAIRDSLKSQVSSAGGAVKDPVGTMLGGLVSSFTTAGSWQRVSEYVVSQCGEKS